MKMVLVCENLSNCIVIYVLFYFMVLGIELRALYYLSYTLSPCF
jgi:hypothetical protein